MPSPGPRPCTSEGGHKWTTVSEHAGFDSGRVSVCPECGLCRISGWHGCNPLPDRYAEEWMAV